MEDLREEMIDRDLASPQFATWTARREAKHQLEVISHLWPDGALRLKALRMFELACEIDDTVEMLILNGVKPS
jgi:hypothetical protein